MPEKILVVDDDVDSLKLIGLMLQRQGYEVAAANNGTQALAKAEADRPNLIILDVMMPDMSGLEVCKRLRQNVNTNKIPIIMFTAKTLIDDKVKGFEAGADDYLTKPTHPAELASRVKAILARNVAKQKEQQPTRKQNMSIGVIGAKGGSGATTVAVNIAAASLMQNDQPVLADFRLGEGSLGLMLGLNRSQGMARLLTRNPDEINQQSVELELVQHQTGLRALLSSTRPKEHLTDFSDETALAVVNVLRTIGRPAVIDLGSSFTSTLFKLQAEMTKIIVVVEPNPVSIGMARDIIQEIEGENNNAGRVNIVVVNHAQSSLQTAWHEVESTLGREIRAIISPAPELAFQAMQSSMPIVMLQPNSILAGQYNKLTEALKTGVKSIAGGLPTS